MFLLNIGKENQHKAGGFFIQQEGNVYSLRFIHSNNAEKASPLKKRQVHRHLVYHLIRIQRGTGTFILENRSCPVYPGDFLSISPGESHCVGVNENENLIFSEVTFEFFANNGNRLGLPFSDLLSIISGIPLASDSIHRNADPGVLSLFDNFIDLITRESVQRGNYPYFHFKAALHLYGLFTSLSGFWGGFDENPVRLTPMEKIHAHISRNFLHPVTLSDLSHIGSLSEKYISRRFKQIYGETPIYYRDSLRIEMACELLRGMHYSISEIAEKCGFSDLFYFSKIFKKRKKVSPGQYRKERT